MISIQGVIGEWVLCSLFDVNPTALFDTQCRNRYNDSFDAVIKGHTIDVKTPMYHHRDLWVNVSKGFRPPDWYCLMTMERTDTTAPETDPIRCTERIEVQFHGFIHSRKLLIGGNVRQRGRLTMYVAKQDVLKTLEEIALFDPASAPRLFSPRHDLNVCPFGRALRQ